MRGSAMCVIVLVAAVTICVAMPQHSHGHGHSHKHIEEERPSVDLESLLRERRSPQGHGKISVLDDSRKGPVARAEGSGTVWESKDKNINAKVGVDYTQQLKHGGGGEGSAFFRVEGKF